MPYRVGAHLDNRIRSLADLGHAFRDFIRQDFKALQSILAECGRDGDIGRVAASRNEHSSNPGHVVPRIKRALAATEIDFKPRCKSRMGRRCAPCLIPITATGHRKLLVHEVPSMVGTTLNGLRGSLHKGPVLKHGGPANHPRSVALLPLAMRNKSFDSAHDNANVRWQPCKLLIPRGTHSHNSRRNYQESDIMIV
jgi:hypothetical protein